MKKVIMVFALVCALSLISVASAQFNSSQTWGSFGSGTGQFYGMSGVDTDTSGNIYIAELDNRVQKFSGNGAYITQFNIPARDIAIDSSGNIYATVNDSIKKFDSTGTLLNTWGSTGTGNRYFNFPTGIALDSSRNIYVSDMENNRIQKLNSSGNYVTSWGTLGSGNGSLKSPAGIAVSGNYVYVADMGNYRIQKFDLSGNYVSSLGSKGTGNTQFNSSIAVANDSSGNIYVADYYNGRVLEYDSSFNYLTQYTGFNHPTALVIANSNLYVLDSRNYRVYEFYNSAVNKSTPTITWNNPANITYGTALSSTQLNANASVPGNFTYNPAAGTLLGVGTYTLHVVFTPTDTANYTTASNDVTINISRTTPTITWSNPANITYGTALSGTQLNANASVPGNPIYNPAAGTVLSVGSHTLHVDFTPLDTANYTNASKDVTINVIENSGLPIANFTANITSGLAPLSVQFNDSSQNATAWSWNFGDGQTSAAKNPRHTYYSPGTYTVSLNASNAVGYNISTKSNLITVNPIPPVTNGLVAYYNGSLSGNSLVDLSGNNNTGYATSVTQGTKQSTGAKYINLNGVNSKIDISNNAQTNISSPISIEFIGSINTFSQYSALVSKYNNGIVGWYLSSSSATPYNHARFGAGLNSGGLRSYESNITLVAGQVYDIVATYDNNVTHIYVNGMDSADPRTWNSPIAGITNNIAIGYSYGLTYCNCSMYTVRIYNRSLSSAEVLQNYNSDLWRSTTKTTPTITWSNPADITYGTPLSSTQLNANASVPGNFTYTPAAGTVLGVGTQTLHVDFTPTDTAIYINASKDVNINVLNSLAADFSAAPTTGKAPLKVTFTDNSQEAPTSWSWNFGDKSTSTDKNPIHEYSKAGKYTVSLTIKNAAGNDTKTMSNYITAVKK